MKILDYIYYRFAEFYKRWDGKDAITAVMAVTLIISMVIIDLLIFIYRVFSLDKYKHYFMQEGSIIVVIVMIIIMAFCHKRYQGKYEKIKKEWSNETKKQKLIRGVLVLVAFFLPILLPFIIVKLW